MDSKYGRIYVVADLDLVGRWIELGTVKTLTEGLAKLDSEGRAKFPADEPLFLLRGQDLAAKGTTAAYLDECEGIGCDRAHVEGVERARADLVWWQEANPERVKVPDS